VPFPFLPRDGLAHTELRAFIARGGRDAATHDEQELRRDGLVASDQAVELDQRHLHLAECDRRVPEAMRAEVLDLARRQLAETLQARISVKATWTCTPIR